ncbi:MAG: hypothetical protein ACREL7_19875 [Longimicrobiales bacterium]
MATANSSRRFKNADLQIDSSSRPGWNVGATRTPKRGEFVYCTDGKAEVIRVCGKTGNGSPLLELRLLDRQAPPFYAATSNVLQSMEDSGDANSGK